MIMSLLIISALIWLTVQGAREKNLAKWKRRFEPLLPIGRHVRKDVFALVYQVSMWRAMRKYRRENGRDLNPEDFV